MRFAANIEALSPEAVRCRAIGHRWVPYTAKTADPKLFKGYNVTLVCDNGCDTMKHFQLSFRGEYYPATYSYGDNYLLEKGNPPITVEDKGQFKLSTLSDILPPETAVTNLNSRRRKAQ